MVTLHPHVENHWTSLCRGMIVSHLVRFKKIEICGLWILNNPLRFICFNFSVTGITLLFQFKWTNNDIRLVGYHCGYHSWEFLFRKLFCRRWWETSGFLYWKSPNSQKFHLEYSKRLMLLLWYRQVRQNTLLWLNISGKKSKSKTLSKLIWLQVIDVNDLEITVFLYIDTFFVKYIFYD